ncbi:hypothetical protein GZH47_23695 [Paenibacillus rhizovicinus]|uniref:YhcN/YlaJ family sporulation lipoprotein n=1 Tax=Paenibacillus rhizovicinus TaxID=2704463 RepID=A0A6C0P4N3_9BACL|nr:YhcN/YlaJ family sporulation lipoprotein [Paenibacillus rhizovicinus]QHW33504.1 hypothetical protein GZH47_23695 [Paenibacillus rhizovicinus]
MQQRKWAVLAAGAMLTTMLAGCMEKHGELGNRNIRGNSVKYDMNGNRILNTRFANDQMNEMNRVDGYRLNSNNLVGLHKNYHLEMSEGMSDRVSNVKGVGKAYVMLSGDNAYVAITRNNAGHGTNAMSLNSPTTIGRSQQAYMRPYNMKTSNAHAFTNTKRSRASSIATPNMHLRSTGTGSGIIRAKSMNGNAMNRNAHTMNAKSYGYSSSSFHNVSNGIRNMSISMSAQKLMNEKNINGLTARHPNGMTNLSRNTGRGLTNLSRDISTGRTNMSGDMMNTRTSNVGRDIYRGTSNAATDLGRGTGNVVTDIARGTGNVGRDIYRGTSNVGTDLARGTGNVVTDITRGTGNVGRDMYRGTSNAGTDLARGTGNVVTDVARGTGNAVTDVARGTGNAVTDVARGTGNVVTDIARGTADVGRDIGRGMRDLSEGTADLFRGTTGLSRDVNRGTNNVARDMYGSGMTNLSRNTTDLSRTVTPYAVHRTADSEVSAAQQAEITSLIQKMSPQIKNVYVSADPEYVERMASYMADVKKGNSIQMYITEFNAMVDRIFPARVRR